MVALKYRHYDSLLRGRLTTDNDLNHIFNYYKYTPDRTNNSTIFQQLFASKRNLRSYHGEHLTEKQFKNNWVPNLHAVSKLSSKADITTDKIDIASQTFETPYQMQAVAFLEKRLDVAIYRALLAPSVRVARKIILSKGVTVNDVYIRDPNYKLKPNDFVKCDPEKVVRYLGHERPLINESLRVDALQVAEWNEELKNLREDPSGYFPQFKFKIDGLYERDPKRVFFEKLFAESKRASQKAVYDLRKNNNDATIVAKIFKVLKNETPSAEAFTKEFLNDSKLGEELFAWYNKFLSKLSVEKYSPEAPKTSSEANLTSESVSENLNKEGETETPTKIVQDEYRDIAANVLADSDNADVRTLKNNLSTFKEKYFRAIEKNAKVNDINLDWIKTLKENEELPEDFAHQSYDGLEKDDIKAKEEELQEKEKELAKHISLPWQQGHLWGRKNPDLEYFTPWKPKPFLGCLAVAPFHIEVNFRTCQFIYLRDPISRPGHSEVISPYGLQEHKNAYLYYKARVNNRNYNRKGAQ
ncbi:unnamed protein product [Hanseniaspora opuntiae]